MRQVIHVSISLDHGGLERLVVDWTRERQVRCGQGSTSVVCIDRPGELAALLPAQSVVCLREGGRPLSDFAGWRALAAVVRSRQADGEPVVLHCHNLRAWQYGVMAGLMTGARVVYTQHGANVHNFGWVNRWRCRLLSLFTSKIVTVSDATRDAMEKEYGLPRRRVIVVPNGVGVTGVEGYKVTELQGDKVSELQGYKVTELQSSSIPTFHDSRVAELQSDKVIESQGDRVTGVQSYSIPTFQHSKVKELHGDGLPSFQNSNIPTVQHSNVPTSSHSNIPAFQSSPYSTLQLFHSSRLALRQRLGLSVDAVIIGSVGRLASVKGYDRLIAAVASTSRRLCMGVSGCRSVGVAGTEASDVSALDTPILPHSHTPTPPHPLLLFIGDGPERGALEKLAEELGLKECVIFAGYQEEPGPWLACMDLFVLSSRSEGMSVALLEAMAAGVPVLVTDVGANREIIEDGQAGALLPDDDTLWPDVIGAALSRDNTETVARARKRVEQCYSMDATLKAYEAVYGVSE